jgi:hypothetical protein
MIIDGLGRRFLWVCVTKKQPQVGYLYDNISLNGVSVPCALLYVQRYCVLCMQASVS